jgi:uncharacterized protein YxjI
MATTGGGPIKGIDLSDDEYRVVQSLIRNKYSVYDDEGDLLLKAKQKLFRMKEEFPFTDPEGNVVFRVKAEGILDISGDYVIVDEATGDPVVILDKNFTLLKHTWEVRDPGNGGLLATIESRGAAVELLRSIPYLSIVTSLIPHKYTIEDHEGDALGTIEGQLSMRDTYDISLSNAPADAREALVASAIAIDALEGN